MVYLELPDFAVLAVAYSADTKYNFSSIFGCEFFTTHMESVCDRFFAPSGWAERIQTGAGAPGGPLRGL